MSSSLAQLTALQQAVRLIEEAARGSHRDLAPHLAASVAGRLNLLTDARYVDVNVDTDHFAVALLNRERPEMKTHSAPVGALGLVVHHEVLGRFGPPNVEGILRRVVGGGQSQSAGT